MATENAVANEIRITDQHVIRLVKTEQKSAGEKTPTKTAGRLLAEYIAFKKLTGAAKQQGERANANAAASVA